MSNLNLIKDLFRLTILVGVLLFAWDARAETPMEACYKLEKSAYMECRDKVQAARDEANFNAYIAQLVSSYSKRWWGVKRQATEQDVAACLAEHDVYAFGYNSNSITGRRRRNEVALCLMSKGYTKD